MWRSSEQLRQALRVAPALCWALSATGKRERSLPVLTVVRMNVANIQLVLDCVLNAFHSLHSVWLMRSLGLVDNQ